MDILSLALILFAVMETMNVIILYFAPESTYGNAMGFFKAYEKSKSDPEVHQMVRYLVNWVAGVKLIFIVLVLVISFTGSDTTKLLGVGALILSILSFYFRLYPIIKGIDANGGLEPKGYSRTLNYMIVGILIVFTAALIAALVI